MPCKACSKLRPLHLVYCQRSCSCGSRSAHAYTRPTALCRFALKYQKRRIAYTVLTITRVSQTKTAYLDARKILSLLAPSLAMHSRSAFDSKSVRSNRLISLTLICRVPLLITVLKGFKTIGPVPRIDFLDRRRLIERLFVIQRSKFVYYHIRHRFYLDPHKCIAVGTIIVGHVLAGFTLASPRLDIAGEMVVLEKVKKILRSSRRFEVILCLVVLRRSYCHWSLQIFDKVCSDI